MKNWEKYEKEIRSIVSKNGSLAVKNNKPASCIDIECSECIGMKMSNCEGKILDWLYTEVDKS